MTIAELEARHFVRAGFDHRYSSSRAMGRYTRNLLRGRHEDTKDLSVHDRVTVATAAMAGHATRTHHTVTPPVWHRAIGDTIISVGVE